MNSRYFQLFTGFLGTTLRKTIPTPFSYIAGRLSETVFHELTQTARARFTNQHELQLAQDALEKTAAENAELKRQISELKKNQIEQFAQFFGKATCFFQVAYAEDHHRQHVGSNPQLTRR